MIMLTFSHDGGGRGDGGGKGGWGKGDEGHPATCQPCHSCHFRHPHQPCYPHHPHHPHHHHHPHHTPQTTTFQPSPTLPPRHRRQARHPCHSHHTHHPCHFVFSRQPLKYDILKLTVSKQMEDNHDTHCRAPVISNCGVIQSIKFHYLNKIVPFLIQWLFLKENKNKSEIKPHCP